MWFSSSVPCRQSRRSKTPFGKHRHGTSGRRVSACRLSVETLEARLPPGDILLSKLWGATWLGANSPATGSASAGVPLANSPAAMSVRWSTPETQQSAVNLIQRHASDQAQSEITG